MTIKYFFVVLFTIIVNILHAQTPSISITGTLSYKSGEKVNNNGLDIDISHIGSINDENWTLDGEVIDITVKVLKREDDGKIIRRVGKTNEGKTIISNGLPLTVIDRPQITGIIGFPTTTVSVSSVLNLVIEAVSNGSPITKYEWFLGEDKLYESSTNNTLQYIVRNSDHDKVLKVIVTNACSTDEATTTFIDNGSLTTPINTSLTPQIADNTIFPVSIGDDFIDPTITYTAPYYYVTTDVVYNGVSTADIAIPYLNNAQYNCKVVNNINEALAAISTAKGGTIFLDDTHTHYPNRYDKSVYNLSYENMRLVGAKNSGATVGPCVHSEGLHRTYILYFPNIVIENLTFDGENKQFLGGTTGNEHNKNVFYFMSVRGAAENCILKNIKFRNMGKFANNRTVLNILGGDTDTTPGRYFLNLTFEETAKYSAAYSLININTANKLRFRDIDIKSTDGSANSIDISHSTTFTGVANDIIFAGNLDIPAGKKIRMLSYLSRGISFPSEYRYLQLINTSWTTSSTATYAIETWKDALIPASTTKVIFDAKESTYIVQQGLASHTVQAQLDRIQRLFTYSHVNNACTLPLPTIKLIANNSNIGGFSAPNLGDLPVNIVGLNELMTPLNSTDLIKYNNTTISLPDINSKYIKLHNIDFSDYYHIYDAITEGQDEVTNSRYGSFYNCRFKDFITDKSLKITGDIIASLNGNNILCKDDDGNTNLQLSLTGADLADGWEVTVTTDINVPIENKEISGVVDQNVSITHNTSNSGTKTYHLLEVKNNSREAFVSNETATVTVNDLPTASISGSRTITSGTSAELEITFTGQAPWSVVIDNHGTIDNITTSPYKFTVSPTNTTTYTLTSVRDNYCVNTATGNAIITVTQPTTPPTPVEPTPEEPKPEEPKPEEPKPIEPGEPEAGIKLESNQIICNDELTVTIPVETLYKDSTMQYIIRFSESAHAVGIQDQTVYRDLVNDQVSFTIPANVPSAIYQGTVVIKGKENSNLISDYPFDFEVLLAAKITKQPVSVTNICDRETFTLTVEAIGDALSYQWYHNNKSIPGANTNIYQETLSVQTEGEYFVEVISTCGKIVSDTVTVSAGGLRILIKWDDVLYIMNTNKKYVSFQWYKDNVAINPYGTAVFYTDEKNGLYGTYKVRAYKTDGTYDESCSIFFDSITKSTSVSVYPSLINRNAPISVVVSEATESTVAIYDMAGKKVYSGRTFGTDTKIPMNVPTGTYLVQITLESGKVVTQKIIVK